MEGLRDDDTLKLLEIDYDTEISDLEQSDGNSGSNTDEEIPVFAEMTPVKYPGGALDLLRHLNKNTATRNLFEDADPPGSSDIYFGPDGDGPSRAPAGAEPRPTPEGGGGDPVVTPSASRSPVRDSHDFSDSQSVDDESLADRISRLDGIWDEKHRRPKVQQFKEKVGSDVPNSCSAPVGYFLLLLPEDYIEEIVYQTNLYAVQSEKSFTATNCKEIKSFLAANLMMGITQKPAYRDYWSANVQLRDPYISSLIAQKRFSWLLKNLHVNDNTKMLPPTDSNRDKLFKIRPMIEILSRTFKLYYHPTRKQNGDEAMVKFKGRSMLKQYLPKKPTKRGFKIWVRADERGYVVQLQVYAGKSDQPETNLGEQVIIDLSRDLIGKYYMLYCDNYFTSVSLLRRLLADGIYGCRTIQAGRKSLPKVTATGKPQRGSIIARSSYTGLAYTEWQDSRPVRVLSNFHDAFEVGTANRKNRDGTIIEVPCLKMILDYNMYMGDVYVYVKSDMLRSYYQIDRKSKKWWLRLFWYLIDVTVCNAYIIFHSTSNFQGAKMTMKEFRLAVVSGLVKSNVPTPKGRKRAAPPPERKDMYRKKIPYDARIDQAAHLPVSCSRRRCAYCSTKSKQVRTYVKCKLCDVPLCAKDCFEKFHSSRMLN